MIFKGNITKFNHSVCNIKISELLNSRDGVKICEEIIVRYDCVVKIASFYLVFIVNFCKELY